MKNNLVRITLAGLLTAAIVFAPAAGRAQDKPKTPPGNNQEGKPTPGSRAMPFRGKITAIDKSAKTVTLGERVFHVTAETKIVKDDKPATLADAAVGDVVAGNYSKGDDGKLTARMIRFGPKPAEGNKPPKKDKSEKPPTPQ